MIRNLKVLGLALAAVFAMSAVAASAASAQGVLTADTNVTLIGVNTEGANTLTAFGGSEVKCPNVVYTGHEAGTTAPHELIPSGSSSVTITPHYGACEADEFPATVDMNGCDYTLHLGETTGSPSDTYGVTATIECEGGGHIQVTVFTGASHSIRACTITVTENEAGYPGLDVRDTTNGHIDLFETATEIEVHRSGFGCASGTDENAKLDLDVTVHGVDADGKEVPIKLSH